ncbi:hypothetical protein Leryth_005380 [Lithospermum erythrorhizon]|nr:hypothetical protein Leryth_005380 [Lithospermum erythrorhizon]
MKAVGVFVLFLVISTILTWMVICSRLSASIPASLVLPLMYNCLLGMHTRNADDMARIVKIRKLKENIEEKKGQIIEVEDYRPIDPVPSSKASVRPGPIQHGSPLIPYIPKPGPASPPRSPKP